MTTTATHPQLFSLVGHYLELYRVEHHYVSKADLRRDIKRDYAYGEVLAEAADPQHPNAETALSDAVEFAVNQQLTRNNGWWANSKGRGATHFHEDFATSENWRDNCNLRIEQAEDDESALKIALDKCERACQREGKVFDPQYDSLSGVLVEVLIHNGSVAFS